MSKNNDSDFQLYNPGHLIREKLRVGMSISFGKLGQEQTDAVVVKINKKNVKVRTVQARRNAPAGTEWNVSPVLITIREDADFQPPSAREVTIQRIAGEMTKHNISLADIEKAWG